MSLFISKDKKELIVTCKCGCDEAAHIIIDKDDYDTYAIMSFMNGNFYRDQYGTLNTIKEKCKKIFAIVFNKDYYYADVIMNKKEFLQLKEYINGIEVENNG